MTNEQRIKFLEKHLGIQHSTVPAPPSAPRKRNDTIRHTWTEKDERLVFKLYKQDLGKEEVKEAIKNTKLKLKSVLMRLLNYKYLETGKGLPNASKLTRKIFYSEQLKSL